MERQPVFPYQRYEIRPSCIRRSVKRLQTDYIDLGMIHYIDSEEEWEQIQHSDYMDYVMELKNTGVIRHIGMSSHNLK